MGHKVKRYGFTRCRIILFIIILLIIVFSQMVFAEEVLVKNAGFEDERNGKLVSWGIYDWKNRKEVTELRLDDSQKRSGKSSALVKSLYPNDARIKQTVKVESDSYYKISCWVKTEKVGYTNIGANISVEGISVVSEDVKGTTNGWRYIDFIGKTGTNQKKMTITLGIGGYGSLNSGTAWFDDVSVEKLESLPKGVKPVNFYTDLTDSSGWLKDASNGIMFWFAVFLALIIISFVLFIVTFNVLHLKKARKFSYATEGENEDDFAVCGIEEDSNNNIVEIDNIEEINNVEDKNAGNLEAINVMPRNKKKRLLDKKDIIIVTSMTIIYLVIALFNLGSTKVPDTYWTPIKPGESFTIDFGREVELDRMYFYFGLGDGKYHIEYFDEWLGEYYTLKTIEKSEFDDMYIWKFHTVEATVTNLTITADTYNSMIYEIGFFEKGSTTPLEGFTISSRFVEPYDEGTIENLFDEQDLIEYAPSYRTCTYFDEIYHARTAYEHIRRIIPYETTHPPLGKVFMAVGILIFGMNPFGWRFAGTIFGVAMIPFMYAFGKKIFKGRFYAFCSAFLMMFEFMHFVQTRIATIDSYCVFFIIVMYYYLYDYYIKKSYVLRYKKSLMPLFLSGLAFGMGAASKWIGIYAGAGLAFIFFITKFVECRDYVLHLKSGKDKKPAWVKKFVPLHINRTFLWCILFFVVIPAIVYFLSYIPYLMVRGNDLQTIIDNQVYMYKYHSKDVLDATHDYGSKWWSWPLMLRPMWFYGGGFLPEGVASSIVCMGNPAIWWVGTLAVFAAIIISIVKRDKSMVPVFIAAAFQYIPWIFIKRVVFIYHYFSTVPFIILSIVYVIKFLLERFPRARYFIYGYLAVVFVLFVMFYPVLSAFEISRDYVDYVLRWLPGWDF